MGRPVHCDICGKLYSSSYVAAHKRLAHRIEKSAADKIMALFNGLFIDEQKKVLEKLTSITEARA
jgi:DNA-directed RNA polymerase subunit N (RpoN/RPB10)